MKYGSFIPLSETDVMEYLKKNGSSDLSNKFVHTESIHLSINVESTRIWTHLG